MKRVAISNRQHRRSRIAGLLVWMVLASGQIASAQSDSQPPGVSGRSPAPSATAVSLTVKVAATFTEPVHAASISFVLRDSTNALVPAALSYDASTLTAILAPQTDLLSSRTYTAVVSGAVDLSGNALVTPAVWSFTTTTSFQDSVVFSDLVDPTVIEFSPDGRVFVAEKSGLIKVFASFSASTPTVFADLRTNVFNSGNGGLRGMSLDPDFPARPYVYVLYTYDGPVGGPAPLWGIPGETEDSCPPANNGVCPVSARLSRLQANGSMMTGAEQVLVADWFQRYPGQPIGGIAFGPDGALYASAGDGASSTFVDYGQSGDPSSDPPEGGALRSQDLRTPADPVGLSGSIIRVHPDTGQPLPQVTSMVVGTPTVDGNGVMRFPVTSSFQGPVPTTVRVLEPTSPAPGRPRRALYVLPVDSGVTGLSSAYSDGLEELRLLDAHNRYNLTLIAPSFHIEPWYGDHATMLDRRLESFVVKDLVPFGDSIATPDEIPQRWVIGFSKSGTGALSLILRHPNVFSAAAAWDAPAQFTNMSAFPGMVQNFGTEANFEQYEIPPLVVTSAQAFSARNRLWISGDQSAWTPHMIQLDTQMTQAGVLHTFEHGGPRTHHWASGWLEGALAALDVNATLAPPVDPNAQRIIAYGLRSPSRFAFRPGTQEIWVGDAGWTDWEEINRIPNAIDGLVENFGWPCYEGAGATAYAAADLAICNRLYAEPATTTPPFYAFHHNQQVIDQEACGTGSGSISGLAFYGTGSYPPSYEGALFFSDYSRHCIWVMPRGTNGLPDPAKRATVVPGAPSPVDLKVGPGGDLFYVDMDGGTVRRIQYIPGNLPPRAVIQAGPLSGPVPLTVSFDGRGSSDPEGGVLGYAWDLDGDGNYNDSTAAQPSFVYATPGVRTVRLRVTDPQGLSDVASVVITIGNAAPTATIASPLSTTMWSVGEVVSFSGSGTDPEQGPLPASSLSWSLILHHCPSACHAHLLQDFVGVVTGSFTAPDHDYPSHLELRLTATDSSSLQGTSSVLILPRTVTLTFESNPAGLQLVVGSVSGTTPFSRTVITNASTAVSAASPQLLGGTSYQFASWSDGGTASHSIVATASQGYVATYAVPADTTAPVRSNGQPAGGLAAGTTQATLSLATSENATCRYATSAGVAYGSMPNTFTTTGALAHARTVTGLANGGSYSFFVRCQDGAGNANPDDFSISFTVGAGAPSGGLVAAYGFEEGAGTSVADASGNGHTGVVSGAAWSTQGRYGNALGFDGVNDWVTVSGTALLNLTTGMTLEAWVYPTVHKPAEWTNVLIKERPGGEVYNLYANIDASVPAVYVVRAAAPGAPVDARGGTQLPLNTWTHLAATYDGTTLRMYVNGTQTGSRAAAGALVTSTGAVRIGGNSIWGEYFQGRIDEIRIYNRALTPAEIATDMATPVGGSPGDSTPPSLSNGLPAGALPAGTTQTTLSLTTSENATCRQATTPGVAYGSMPNPLATTGATAHATPVIGLTNGGSYSFYVRCQDTVGNANLTDFIITFSVAQPADTTPPVRSNGQPTGALTAGTTQTALSLGTDENAACRYATSAGVAYASMPGTFTTTGALAHVTTVTGLANGGSYSFFVRCQDVAGNANPNDFTIAFSVAQPADTTAPVRSNGQPAGGLAAGTTQATLSLATSENATCRYATSAGVAYGSMPNTFTTTGALAHARTVTGLVNGGSYSFFVRCQDGAGNANPNDFTIAFSVAQPADTTAPVRSNGQPAGGLAAGTTQATLSLATSENATCRYATSAGVAYGSMPNTFTTTGALAHARTVTGLANGGSYSFFVRCQDGAGNANPDDFSISFTVGAGAPSGGLVAAYGFEEGAGTSVADASGNGHTGVVSGAAWSTQGRYGNALGFDGVNDWVTVSGTALLNLTTGMTLEAWVYPTVHKPAEWTNVLIKERPGGEVYNLYANIDASVPAVYVVRAAAPGAPVDARGGTQLPLNTWTHLAATYDGTTLRMYVNGTQTGSRAAAGALVTSTGAVRIGGNSIWGEYFQGRIDEIRIYNRALTPAEITADMARPVTP